MRRPVIYFSGVDREAHIKLLAQERAAGMVNAAGAIPTPSKPAPRPRGSIARTFSSA